LAAVACAADTGAVLSYDPNLRLSLWPSPAAAREGILLGWREAHVVKVSEEELAFLHGGHSLEEAARALWHDHLELLVVTEGARGCTYFTADSGGHLPSFAVHSVDTTGAGDAFVAGMLSGLLSADSPWDTAGIEGALTLGNAVAALSTTRIGAMSVLPSRPEVQAFMQASRHALDISQH